VIPTLFSNPFVARELMRRIERRGEMSFKGPSADWYGRLGVRDSKLELNRAHCQQRNLILELGAQQSNQRDIDWTIDWTKPVNNWKTKSE